MGKEREGIFPLSSKAEKSSAPNHKRDLDDQGFETPSLSRILGTTTAISAVDPQFYPNFDANIQIYRKLLWINDN